MTAAIWVWQFLKAVTPDQAATAVKAAGLGDDWIPEVPFSVVATRAVGELRGAKRTREPGVIIWEHRGRSWFADLVDDVLVFEAPKSKQARAITGRLEAAKRLQPKDLADYVEEIVVGWGAIHLLGPLWIVPEAEGSDMLLGMLRRIPGAAVAAIPIDGATVAGEVLALLAGGMAAEAERAAAGLDDLKPATLRRRAEGMRERAEGVARLATIFGIDLSAIGNLLTDTESAIRARIIGQHYAPPLDFSGSAGGHHEQEQIQSDTLDPPAAGGHQLPELEASEARAPAPSGEGTYRKIGDPPPSAPPLGIARKIEVKV